MYQTKRRRELSALNLCWARIIQTRTPILFFEDPWLKFAYVSERVSYVQISYYNSLHRSHLFHAYYMPCQSRYGNITLNTIREMWSLYVFTLFSKEPHSEAQCYLPTEAGSLNNPATLLPAKWYRNINYRVSNQDRKVDYESQVITITRKHVNFFNGCTALVGPGRFSVSSIIHNR
jgi:hypothetical protein